MGIWTAGSQLQQVDETKGRAGVLESKLIASTILESDLSPLDAQPISQTLVAPATDTTSQKLRELQGLRKNEVISEEEFQKKKAQLLEKL